MEPGVIRLKAEAVRPISSSFANVETVTFACWEDGVTKALTASETQ